VRDRRSDGGIRVMAPWIRNPWDRARGEWALVCTCHNVRKLWVARRAERLAAIAPALQAPRTGTGRGTVMGRGGAPRATRDGLLGHPYQIGHLAGRAAPGWREARDRAIFQA